MDDMDQRIDIKDVWCENLEISVVVSVAQQVRALDCGSRGWGFETPHSPHLIFPCFSCMNKHPMITLSLASSTSAIPGSASFHRPRNFS